MSNSAPKCSFCQSDMKPLFQSFYCPKDCDRPEVQEARAKFKAQMEADAKKLTETRIDFANLKKATSNPWGFYYTLPVPGGINVPAQDPDNLVNSGALN